MSVKAIAWAWEQDLKPTTKIILLRMADHLNSDGVCWPSAQHLSDWTGVSLRQVKREIKRLEELGLISVERRKSRSGLNLASVYRLNLMVSHNHQAVSHDHQAVSEWHAESPNRISHLNRTTPHPGEDDVRGANSIREGAADD